MLVLRCTACKKKLLRYDKVGPGEVLRCHKKRIKRYYGTFEHQGRLYCSCGRDIGIDKGGYFNLN